MVLDFFFIIIITGYKLSMYLHVINILVITELWANTIKRNTNRTWVVIFPTPYFQNNFNQKMTLQDYQFQQWKMLPQIAIILSVCK